MRNCEPLCLNSCVWKSGLVVQFPVPWFMTCDECTKSRIVLGLFSIPNFLALAFCSSGNLAPENLPFMRGVELSHNPFLSPARRGDGSWIQSASLGWALKKERKHMHTTIPFHSYFTKNFNIFSAHHRRSSSFFSPCLLNDLKMSASGRDA